MENLGIDIKLLLAQIINFVLFFILFKKFMSTPFLKFLNQERKKDEEKHKALELIKKQEEEISIMEHEMRKNAKKQIDAMLEQAKNDAEKIKQDIVAQAQKESDQIIAHGKAAIETERTTLYKEVKNRSVDLSMLIVNNALKEYLTEDAKKAVTQHILNNVSKEVN